LAGFTGGCGSELTGGCSSWQQCGQAGAARSTFAGASFGGAAAATQQHSQGPAAFANATKIANADRKGHSGIPQVTTASYTAAYEEI
jgi:hypothetical protein